MCDVEMQIVFTDVIENRFIDYANKIKIDSNYSDIWVVSFILKENLDNNNTIRLKKVNSEDVIKVKDYHSIKLIEISLNYCYSIIEQNKVIKVINDEKLKIEGKEWIKLLSSPIWCKSDTIYEEVYILPKHTKKKFISCIFVKKAIDKIIYKKEAFDLSEIDDHYNREEEKEFVKMQKENKDLKKRISLLEKN